MTSHHYNYRWCWKIFIQIPFLRLFINRIRQGRRFACHSTDSYTVGTYNVDDNHDDVDDDRRPTHRAYSFVNPRVQPKVGAPPLNGRTPNGTGKSSSVASKQQHAKKSMSPNVVIHPVLKDELDAASQ